MKLPLQIAFHNLPRTTEFEDAIAAEAENLDEFYNHVMSCRVVVDVPHQHHREGNLYQVRIDITVPGGEIVVNREPSRHEANKDFGPAVRDAFDAARRQLQDFARRQRSDVKTHEAPDHGRVAELTDDHGFIETADGRRVYFHRASVLVEGAAQVAVGADVAFVEEPGDKGPQASTVRVLGKHHYSSP